MDVSGIDTVATSGTSALHRASPRAKLAAFGLVLAAVVLQSNVLVVAAIAVVLIAVVLGNRLPVRIVFGLAAYPAVFAVVFAFAGAPDAITGALFVAKAVTAALAAVTLMSATPYPQVFAPLQAVTPSVVGDAMLMTYRSLFLLAEKFAALRRAIRLRSGLSGAHPIRSARDTIQALGGLILYSFDLAQREYDVMRLRGYENRLRVSMPRGASRAFDAALVVAAAAILFIAVLWRLRADTLNPFSWLPIVFALAALGAALVTRSLAHDRT